MPSGAEMAERSLDCQHKPYCTADPSRCPIRVYESDKCGLGDVLNLVLEVKKDLNIKPGRSSATHRRRIAIAVTDTLVQHERFKDLDVMLETGIYAALKNEQLVCNEIAQEIAYSKVSQTDKRNGSFNPLALPKRPHPEKRSQRLIELIITTLKHEEETEHGDPETSTNFIDKVFGNLS